MDDVITLVSATYLRDEDSETYVYDEYGNPVSVNRDRQVFCKVKSIGRNEFYQAAQSNLRPDFVFVLSHYRDYRGETLVKYTPFGGSEKTYSVIRTYRVGDSDELEIVVEEKMSNG